MICAVDPTVRMQRDQAAINRSTPAPQLDQSKGAAKDQGPGRKDRAPSRPSCRPCSPRGGGRNGGAGDLDCAIASRSRISRNRANRSANHRSHKQFRTSELVHEAPARTCDSPSDPGAIVGLMTKHASEGNARKAAKASEHTAHVDVHNPWETRAKAARTRAANMTREQRSEAAREAAKGCWSKPRATHMGALRLGDIEIEIECAVFADQRRGLV